MPSKPVTFSGSGSAALTGRIELPADEAPVAWAIVAHCFACAPESRAADRVALALAERRVAVLRFDVPLPDGLGAAGPAEADLAADAAQIRAAAAWLAEAHAAPTLLIGHSAGGAAAIVAARDLPEVRAVATVAAPFQ